MKTIGYITFENPLVDRRAWSGTLYKIREAVDCAGYRSLWIPMKPNRVGLFFLKVFTKLTHGLWSHTDFYAWLCAKSIDRDLANKCDYIMFPGGAQMLKYLKVTPPVIYYTDACFRQMVGYYWMNLPAWNVRQGDELERIAIDKSALVMRSSQWAIDSAINDYGCPESKAVVLEFGANIDDVDIISTECHKRGEVFNVLFSGVEWQRKGADIAVDAVKLLNARGVKAKLYLAGIRQEMIPEEYRNVDCVEYLGFLNKNVKSQYDKYVEVVGKCHCLLLPTHAECSAIVLSEAASYGLPVFTYDTGGLANYVVDGVNGYRLASDSTAEDFAGRIIGSIEDGQMSKLHEGALQMYRDRLSWSAWGARFGKLMAEHFGAE